MIQVISAPGTREDSVTPASGILETRDDSSHFSSWYAIGAREGSVASASGALGTGEDSAIAAPGALGTRQPANHGVPMTRSRALTTFAVTGPSYGAGMYAAANYTGTINGSLYL